MRLSTSLAILVAVFATYMAIYTYITPAAHTYKCEAYKYDKNVLECKLGAPFSRTMVMIDNEAGGLEGCIMTECSMEIVTLDPKTGLAASELFWRDPSCSVAPEVEPIRMVRHD